MTRAFWPQAPASRAAIRGTDTNSLLRLRDSARSLAREGMSLLERTRAARTAELIGEELRHRNIRE